MMTMKTTKSVSVDVRRPGEAGRRRAGRIRARVCLLLAGCASLVAPGVATPGHQGALAAQSAAAGDHAPRVGCLRGRPLPACKSFWLVEMQGYTPLTQSGRSVTYSGGPQVRLEAFESTLEWNLGHMVNLSPTFALGGTLSVGPSGGSGIFSGARLRARRWMSPDWSLELSGGLLDSDARYPSARGVTFDARVNIRDQGAFFVRWDGASLAPDNFPESGHFDPGGFQQALSIGAAAGSAPGLIGTAALGLGYVILFGLYLSDS